MNQLVVVSNGHGEDMVGSAIAQQLRLLSYEILALPLVGRGMAYEDAGLEVLGPRKVLPSGGLVWGRQGALWADLRAGWVSMSLAQYATLAKTKSQVTATLAVGDIYSLLVASLWGAKPVFQMQTLVSVRTWQDLKGWRQPFGPLELRLMGQALRVYTRDENSAQWLKSKGISQAHSWGNPMLDAVSGHSPPAVPGPYLLLLPGSRSDAYLSLRQMLEVCRLLGDLPLQPVVAWAGLPLEGMLPPWRWEATQDTQGWWVHPDSTRVYMVSGAFARLLPESKLSLATAGTASEQTAGYGVPLVGFVTGGSTYTSEFAQYQRRLLGEALSLSESNPAQIAATLRQLWSDPAKYRAAQQAGKAAMGQPGAAQRIAQDIHRRLSDRSV